MSAFERAEYIARLTKVKAAMADQALDLLFVTTPENICYLSGYTGWSFYTTQALLVSPAFDEPILVLREMDVACARYTAFLGESNVIGYAEEYIGGAKHPIDFITKVIQERCGPVQRVGIEPGGFFFPVDTYLKLGVNLRQAKLIDAGRLVAWLKTVKSPAEIEVMRQAADIAGRAMRTAFEHIAPGVRECDVAAEIQRTLIRGAPGYGGGVSASLALVSGPRTSAPHIAWTDEKFENNSSANLELGGTRYQYHAGLSRSFYLGTPPVTLVRLSQTVIEGMNAALESVRPGALCEDVEAAWRAVISRAGYQKKSRIGYSIGIGFQPTWLDCTASLQAGDRTVLAPGMTFHMICGMWHGAENVVFSETLRVTESGHEVLTDMPRELLVKG